MSLNYAKKCFNKAFFLSLILFLFNKNCVQAQNNEQLNYKTITLGNQAWTWEMFKGEIYLNGDSIIRVENWAQMNYASKKKVPAFFYDAEQKMNVYNRYVVSDPRGLVSNGWRVPKYEEVKNFLNIAGDGFIREDFSYSGEFYFWSKSVNSKNYITFYCDRQDCSGLRYSKWDAAGILFINKDSNRLLVKNKLEKPSYLENHYDDFVLNILKKTDSLYYQNQFNFSNVSLVSAMLYANLLRPDTTLYGNNKNMIFDSLEIVKQDFHNSDVNCIQISQGNDLIATGSYDNTVKLWGKNGNLLRTILTKETPSIIEFINNDSIMVVVTRSHSLSFWEVNTGKLISKIIPKIDRIETGLVKFLRISPSRKFLMYGGYNTVTLVDLKSKKILKSSYAEGIGKGEFLNVDGDVILVVNNNEFSKSLAIWRKDSVGFEEYNFGLDDKINYFEYLSANLKRGAVVYNSKTSSEESKFCLIDIENSEAKCYSSESNIMDLKFDDGSSFFALNKVSQHIVGDKFINEYFIEINSIDSLKFLAEFKHESFIQHYELSKDSKQIITYTKDDGRIHIWDIAKNELINEFQVNNLFMTYGIHHKLSNKFEDTYATNKNYIYYLDKNKTILDPWFNFTLTINGFIDDIDDSTAIENLNIKSNYFLPSFDQLESPFKECSLPELVFKTISEDNKTLITVSSLNRIKFWDTETGNLILDLGKWKSEIDKVGISDDLNYLFLYDKTSGIFSVFDLVNQITQAEIVLPNIPNGFCIDKAQKSILINFSNQKDWYIFNLKNGRPIIHCKQSDSDTTLWTINTPDGYFMSSKSTSASLHFAKGNDRKIADQFELMQNRPDIVLQRMGVLDSNLISAYKMAYLKRLKKNNLSEEFLLNNNSIPEIKILNKKDIPPALSSSKLELHLKITDTLFELNKINVWINNVSIYGVNGIPIKGKLIDNFKLNLDLVRGRNTISISVLNKTGAESFKEVVELDCKAGKEKPDLYIISIGESKFIDSSFNLTYAAKDAKDFAVLFGESSAFENKFHKTILNENVTRKSIKNLKSFLAKADINDQVIVFLAGHGLLDENMDYYLATYDVDFNSPAEKGLPYEELEDLLSGIKPLKKILIIDACHSGELDKEEVEISKEVVMKKESIKFRSVGNSAKPKIGLNSTSELTKLLFTDLRKGTGATIISSAGGMELAMESGNWSNGLFTYCFLNGITTMEADLNKDNEIWLSEIQNYVSNKVVELSNGLQQPTSRLENLVLDYRIW